MSTPTYTPIPGTPWYLSPDNGPLMKRDRRMNDAPYVAVFPCDAPIVHCLIRLAAHEAPPLARARYDVELNAHRAIITYDELHTGRAWRGADEWSTLGIRGDVKDYMAATVEYLARRAPRRDGGHDE